MEKEKGLAKKGQSFWADERGEIGVKQIAATVAVIVVIGMVISAINSNLSTWISDLWDYFMKLINELTGSGA